MKKPLTIRLCGPRGFCAGVDRAIQIVVLALKKYGAPVYVRHEIVHNRYVVEGLQERGAVFVEELSEIPPEHGDRPVVFSAHGVPKSVPQDAEARNLFYLDATCPLVSKVHKQAMRHHRQGRHVLLIGHAGHPEVIGTMGQLPEGAVTLVETEEDAARIAPADPQALGFVTQTTLSVEDTAGIIRALDVGRKRNVAVLLNGEIRAPFKRTGGDEANHARATRRGVHDLHLEVGHNGDHTTGTQLAARMNHRLVVRRVDGTQQQDLRRSATFAMPEQSRAEHPRGVEYQRVTRRNEIEHIAEGAMRQRARGPIHHHETTGIARLHRMLRDARLRRCGILRVLQRFFLRVC